MVRSISPSMLCRSKGTVSNSSLPASIFEKSRMSLITASSDSAELRTMPMSWRWSGVSLVSSTSSAMPMMPFMRAMRNFMAHGGQEQALRVICRRWRLPRRASDRRLRFPAPSVFSSSSVMIIPNATKYLGRSPDDVIAGNLQSAGGAKLCHGEHHPPQEKRKRREQARPA